MTRSEQHEDGVEEAQRRVQESLLHIHYEQMGYSWKAARDLARSDMQQLRLGQEVRDLAIRQATRRLHRYAH